MLTFVIHITACQASASLGNQRMGWSEGDVFSRVVSNRVGSVTGSQLRTKLRRYCGVRISPHTSSMSPVAKMVALPSISKLSPVSGVLFLLCGYAA
jgi:hypothetical protein